MYRAESAWPLQSLPDPLYLAPQRRVVVEAQPIQREPLRPGRPDQWKPTPFINRLGRGWPEWQEQQRRGQMNDRSRAQIEADYATIAPPSWAQCFMAFAGVVLLIGPTLGVLWPR